MGKNGSVHWYECIRYMSSRMITLLAVFKECDMFEKSVPQKLQSAKRSIDFSGSVPQVCIKQARMSVA
jgi:hypothetical protein